MVERRQPRYFLVLADAGHYEGALRHRGTAAGLASAFYNRRRAAERDRRTRRGGWRQWHVTQYAIALEELAHDRPGSDANQGGIAIRVTRTAHAFGLSTVPVFTEAERGALHIDVADFAVEVPSYLDAGALVDPALRTDGGPPRLRPPVREGRLARA